MSSSGFALGLFVVEFGLGRAGLVKPVASSISLFSLGSQSPWTPARSRRARTLSISPARLPVAVPGLISPVTASQMFCHQCWASLSQACRRCLLGPQRHAAVAGEVGAEAGGGFFGDVEAEFGASPEDVVVGEGPLIR